MLFVGKSLKDHGIQLKIYFRRISSYVCQVYGWAHEKNIRLYGSDGLSQFSRGVSMCVSSRGATLLPFLVIPANSCHICLFLPNFLPVPAILRGGRNWYSIKFCLIRFFPYIRPFYCILKHFTSEVAWGTYGQGK